MQKIISIIGPTATGKTSLALKIADKITESKKYRGIDIISVDSRQVYQGLEIVSGADLPEKLNPNINIHGVSIIRPDQEWSLAHFRKMALKIIGNAEKTNRLVILVGGTGLYHDRLFSKNNYLGVKPDLQLRQNLENLSVLALQNKLKSLDQQKFINMNNSDRQNPRRLIRAIEIASVKEHIPAGVYPVPRYGTGVTPVAEKITIGLTDSLENINSKIKKRVLERFKNGAITEVQNLLKNYASHISLPALSATGVLEISQYLNQELSEPECLEAWTLREYQYAKRQITWWKKNKDIYWHEINTDGGKKQAFKKALDFVL